jgi:hypothetical protein
MLVSLRRYTILTRNLLLIVALLPLWLVMAAVALCVQPLLEAEEYHRLS